MKKYLGLAVVFSVLAVSLFINPGRVAAQTASPSVDALRTQILTLLAQIQELQQKLAVIKGGGSPPWGVTLFACGDVNQDGVINAKDVDTLSGYAFQGVAVPWGVNADLNVDGMIDVLDVTSLIGFVYRNGPAPTCSKTGSASAASGQAFVSGEKVAITDYLRVRATPDGQVLTVKPTGVEATVIGTPVLASGYLRLQVSFSDGTSGWVAQDWLKKTPSFGTTLYACGDVNWDGAINANDVNRISDYIFGGVAIPAGVRVDMNGDGVTDVLDVTALVNHVNRGGPAPTCTASFIPPPVTWNPPAPVERPAPEAPRAFACGDMDQSGAVDKNDVSKISEYAFQGVAVPAGVNADLNADGVVNVLDVVILTNYTYRGGPAPTCAVTPITAIKGTFICGDANSDGLVSKSDVDSLTNFAFRGVAIPGGILIDLNADGVVDVVDVTILNDYIYRGKAAPTCTAASNRPPIISSFTGPDLVRSYNVNSWTVTASDPENEMLTYTVDWKDGKSDIYSGASGAGVTISHTYNTGGKYVISVMAADKSGQKATSLKTVELPYTSVPLFTAFYSNGGVPGGPVEGATISTRDPQGVLTDFKTVKKDGMFLVYAFGDDSLTRNIDEGATMGDSIKFYADGRECLLVSGSNIWVDRANREIGLSCGVSDAKSLPKFACGDINQNGSIDRDDVSKISDYIFNSEPIPAGVNVDMNGDKVPDARDVTVLTDHVYRGKAAPTCMAAPIWGITP